MIIKEIGKYKFIRDWTERTSIQIGTFPAGTILDIAQIDESYHKVIGEPLSDWAHWDLPVKKL